jgi:hypothetical protein
MEVMLQAVWIGIPIEPRRTERGGAPDEPMHLVSFFEQQRSEVHTYWPVIPATRFSPRHNIKHFSERHTLK